MLKELLIKHLVKVQILDNIPGRLRIHIPAAKKIPKEWHLDAAYLSFVQRIPGIQQVEFSYTTATAVILYDPSQTSPETIIAVFNDILRIAAAHWQDLKHFKPHQKDEAVAYLSGILEAHLKLGESK